MAVRRKLWQSPWPRMPANDAQDPTDGPRDVAAPMDPDSPAEAELWNRWDREPAPPPDSRDGSLPPDAPLPPLRWRKNLILFVVTTLSVFLTGALYEAHGTDPMRDVRSLLRALPSGWKFAVPLMSILLVHELGHFFAARYHRVPASLPFFIPLPLLSPFGTMGAVIGMRGRIRSRNALLDIGAAGPLAGLVVALPVLIYGLMTSPVRVPDNTGWQEGQSLLYLFLKRVILGPIPVDRDVILNSMAFAGWSGLFVTALNLLPVYQLDGGHVAYALLGPRQNRIGRWIHWGLLLVFAFNFARFMAPVVRTGRWADASMAFQSSNFWLWWFFLLHILARLGGKDHPPTDPGELSPRRRVVAVFTLVLFILLFMPTPLAAL
jgi:membrane-associated protease RseP (regulator of RpoE activity)